jgi:hypothetical protein
MVQEDERQQISSYLAAQVAKGPDYLKSLMDRTISEWDACLDGLTDEAASARQDGEWTAKEVLGHILIGIYQLNHMVADALGVSIDDPNPDRPIMGERWEEKEHLPLADLKAEVRQGLTTTRSLADSAWANPGDQTFTHPWFGSFGCREWLVFQRVHCVDHIRQIQALKTQAS